ncbi:MAG: DinB family protein [Bryobacteraceae bacterium]
MNYYGAQELAASFRTVRKNTLVIANDIGEQHYGFRATPETRTVGHTLVHIAQIYKLQDQVHRVERRTTLEDFDFPGFFGPILAEEQTPRTKAEIIALLKGSGERFALWLQSLSDEFLGERVMMRTGMTPPFKTRFEMILGVKEHEMHHRGQLMLLERMVGVEPHLTREGRAFLAAAMAAKQ